MHTLMEITNAAVLSELQHDNPTLRAIVFGLSYPRFLVDYAEAQLINSAFHRRPNVVALKEIWNLPEKGAIRHLKYVQFEAITTNTLIHVPKDSLSIATSSLRISSADRVPVRIIYSGKVVLADESQPMDAPVIDTAVAHMHGGGFIALSSCTMQSYTRKWANQLGVPVLSIDYSKPPEHRYPEPLWDVEAVYRFVVE